MSIEAQRGSGGVAPVHSNLGDRSGEVIRTKPGLLHPKKHTIPILQKRAWVSGCLDGTENLDPTGNRLSDRSACSEPHIFFNVVYRLM